MKLGRLPRPSNARFLRLRDYAPLGLPPAPSTWDGTPNATIAMYANDQLGDCTIAGLANLASIQAAAEGRSCAFTDDEIRAFYFAITGGADTGAVEVDVLGRVLSSGFPADGTYRLRGWAGVEHADLDELRSVAALFAGVYLGVELPDGWEAGVDAGAWSDASAPANPDNGHCLVLAGYDADGAMLATWGRIVKARWAWMRAYVVEAYVLLDADRLAVDVLNGAALAADLAALAAETGEGG